jgi:hypothetical protein
MTDWPDEKIRSTALWYVGKHSMNPELWRWTRFREPHPEVMARVVMQPGELPLISFFLSEASWYLLTTRRVVGSYFGQGVDVAALDVREDRFFNFKGLGGQETEVMTLRLNSGAEVMLE